MDSDDPFEAVSHPLRIEILKLLAKNPRKFADIKRKLNIESSGLLDFHLKKLEALLSINNEGCYVLNEKGSQLFKQLKPYQNMAGRKGPSI